MGIVSSMFDGMISHLVQLKHQHSTNNASNIQYVRRASQAILSAIGIENLLPLVGFLPSLNLLFGNGNSCGGDGGGGEGGGGDGGGGEGGGGEGRVMRKGSVLSARGWRP